MRSLLALLFVTTVFGAARADGPDEPRNADAPAAAAPATPAPAEAAPAPAPAQVVAPAPAPAPVVAAPAAATATGGEILPNPPKIYGWAFGGAALGSWLIGGILTGVASARSSEQEGNVNNPPLYTKGLQDRAAEGKTLATTGYVFIGLGAALTVVDAVLWFEILRKPRTTQKSAARDAARFFSKAAAVLSPAGVQF